MTISQINPNELRPSGDDAAGPIIRIPPNQVAEAVERLVAAAEPGSGFGASDDREHARRFMDYAATHGINLDLMWARLDRMGRVQQTVLCVPSPGRTAMVFVNRVLNQRHIGSLAGVIDAAVQELAQHNVKLRQVLLDPGDQSQQQAFESGGFEHLAMLSYLERPIRLSRSFGSRQPVWPNDVIVSAYSEGLRDEMLAVLAASYEDTLDRPGLRGCRETSDVLAGHRASGVFDPSLWTIMRIDGRAAGALLLNPSADHQTIELVYLGLVKAARGQGLGTQLLRHGLSRIADRREKRITLAVDEANNPAIELYQREGFRPVLRRMAMIRRV